MQLTALPHDEAKRQQARYLAIIVGLVLGHFAGASSPTLAKLSLLINGEEGYSPGRLAEASLHMILFVTAGIVCIGVVAAFRDIVKFQDVLTAAFSATLFAFVAILDYGLPGPNGSVQLPLREPAYYFGWVAALWVPPFFFLPTRDKQFRARVQQGCEVLLMTTAMTIAGILVGLLLEEMSGLLLAELHRWTDREIVTNTRYFWIALPATLNAVVGAYAGVAFLNLWWPGRWRSSWSAWLWTLGVSAFALPYAGLYGLAILENGAHASEWNKFSAFGGVSLAALVAVLTAYHLTRLVAGVPSSQVSGSSAFGWLLAGSLSIGFGLTAWLGLAPLAELESSATEELTALVVAHGVNGAVLGATLFLVLKLVRLAKRPSKVG